MHTCMHSYTYECIDIHTDTHTLSLKKRWLNTILRKEVEAEIISKFHCHKKVPLNPLPPRRLITAGQQPGV